MGAKDAGATTVLRAHGVLSGIVADAVKSKRLSANPNTARRTSGTSLSRWTWCSTTRQRGLAPWATGTSRPRESQRLLCPSLPHRLCLAQAPTTRVVRPGPEGDRLLGNRDLRPTALLGPKPRPSAHSPPQSQRDYSWQG